MRRVCSMLLSVVLLTSLSLGTNAQTVLTFHTGNAPVGQQDPIIWLQGAWASGPTDPRPGLTGAPYALQHPFVVSTPSFWGAPVAGNSYVAPSAGATGVGGGWEYFVEFTLPAVVTQASLNLSWHGDDGAYPNVNGTYIGFGYGTGAGAPPANQTFNILSLVHAGTNRLSLFVENANIGSNPTGVDFSAQITYQAVPETGSVSAAGIGMLGVLLLGKSTHKRKQERSRR